MSEPIEPKFYHLEFSTFIHKGCSLLKTCDQCSDKLLGRYVLRSCLYWIYDDMPADPWEKK